MKRFIALALALCMCLSLCACKKKDKKRDDTAQPVATEVPNEVFEVKLTEDNLWDYFYFKEYRSDTKADDGRIESCQIAYGLQLNEYFTAVPDDEYEDTMKIKFTATGVVNTGDYEVDFDTLSYSGTTYSVERTEINESLQFWPKGNRTSTWAFGNYSTSYILYFENFAVTDVSGSIFIKRAEPTETEAPQQ